MKNTYINPKATPLADHPGFFISDRYPKYAVNVKGEILRSVDGKPMEIIKLGEDRYPNIRGDVAVHVHNLIADVFVEKPESLLIRGEKITVNHIDGDKSNYSLDNLEWITAYNNNVHVIENGLRSARTELISKNHKTGEILHFPSMGSCCYKLNLSKGQLDSYLRRMDKSSILINGKYTIIKNGEEWPIMKENCRVHIMLPKDWILLDTRTNVAYIVYTLEKVSELAEYDFKQVKEMVTDLVLKDIDNIKLRLGHFILYSYDFFRRDLSRKSLIKDIRKEKAKNASNRGGSKPKKILVTDVSSNESKVWENSEIFAKEVLNMGKKSFQRNVHRNNGYFCEAVSLGKGGGNKRLYKIDYL